MIEGEEIDGEAVDAGEVKECSVVNFHLSYRELKV